MSQVGFFFYTGDWIKDTRILSLDARGAWIDLLCVLNENGGEITWSIDDLTQFWAVDSGKTPAILQQISSKKVADVAEMSPGIYRIRCRSMYKRLKFQEQKKIQKQKERERWHKREACRHDVASLSPQCPAPLLNPSLNPSSGSFLRKEMENPAPPALAKKLDPLIKESADKVYAVDNQKYARLIQWIKAAERTYSATVIALTLERFLPYATTADPWWPYLDKLLDKEEGKENGRETQQQSDHYKQQDRDFAKNLFRRT